MAGLGGKNWTFQEEVTSSDVNGYLADQVVMRFGGTASRDAGFGGSGEPTLAEGMVTYLDDANRLDFYDGAAWKPVSKVLQVVSTIKNDTASTSSQSWQDITGMSVSITPSSASSKILVLASYQTGSSNSNTNVSVRLVRDSTPISVGAAAGNRLQASTVGYTEFQGTFSINFLDSPATVSATTYKLQWYAAGGSTCYMNRVNFNDDDISGRGRTASNITVMEIGA